MSSAPHTNTQTKGNHHAPPIKCCAFQHRQNEPIVFVGKKLNDLRNMSSNVGKCISCISIASSLVHVLMSLNENVFVLNNDF